MSFNKAAIMESTYCGLCFAYFRLMSKKNKHKSSRHTASSGNRRQRKMTSLVLFKKLFIIYIYFTSWKRKGATSGRALHYVFEKISPSLGKPNFAGFTFLDFSPYRQGHLRHALVIFSFCFSIFAFGRFDNIFKGYARFKSQGKFSLLHD